MTPCPDDAICQRCPAACEDDVCLPHEREAVERADPLSIQSLGDALRPTYLEGLGPTPFLDLVTDDGHPC